MRFMVATNGGGRNVYSVLADEAVNLSALDPRLGTDLSTLISMGEEGLALARHLEARGGRVPLETLTPALPLEAPSKILCLGLNYVDHVKEGGYDIPTYPAMFIRLISSMIAADEPMVRPTCSEKLDYEVELMIIIGQGGRHIRREDALDHVFGYTIFNDGSVRDYQRKTHQWTPGKNFDATGPVGPLVVTPDELPPGASGLKIESRLNGQIMQSASTADMMWPVDQIIETVSEFATLEPGDMIATGTPPGVGHARKPPVFMKHGDVIEAEIEGIGICRNPVVDETSLPVSEAAE